MSSCVALEAKSVCARLPSGLIGVDEGRVTIVGFVLSFNRDDAELAHHGVHVRARTARDEPMAWVCIESSRQLAHRLRRIVFRIQSNREQPCRKTIVLDALRGSRKLGVDQRASVGAVRRDERDDQGSPRSDESVKRWPRWSIGLRLALR